MHKFIVKKDDIIPMIGEPDIYLIQDFKDQDIMVAELKEKYSIGQDIEINGEKMVIHKVIYHTYTYDNTKITNGIFGIQAK